MSSGNGKCSEGEDKIVLIPRILIIKRVQNLVYDIKCGEGLLFITQQGDFIRRNIGEGT